MWTSINITYVSLFSHLLEHFIYDLNDLLKNYISWESDLRKIFELSVGKPLGILKYQRLSLKINLTSDLDTISSFKTIKYYVYESPHLYTTQHLLFYFYQIWDFLLTLHIITTCNNAILILCHCLFFLKSLPHSDFVSHTHTPRSLCYRKKSRGITVSNNFLDKY